MTNTFSVTTGDIDKTIAILREVAQWCIDNRTTVWTLENLTAEKLTVGLDKSNFCVAKVNDVDAGCMILQWYDSLFWPEAKEYEACYVHKLCVKHEFAGQNLSTNMIDYAIQECKKRNVKYVRLDTAWQNEKLCSMYEKLGFVKVGRKTIDIYDFALYEKLID